MEILSLHENQLSILTAIRSAIRILQMKDHLTIIGSLGRSLAGEAVRVGDIDVMIDNSLCKRYWDFVEILSLHGIISFWDVLNRPRFPWSYCQPDIGHVLSLTIHCCANYKGLSYANLDVKLTASDLDYIPDSSRWVGRLALSELKAICDETSRDQKIKDEHEKFVKSLKDADSFLTNVASSRVLHNELGLYFSGK